MFVIIGYLIVLGSCIGGFVLAGGHVAALIQPLEVLIIGGTAIGASVVAHGGKPLKIVIKALPTLFQGSKFTKALYMELFALLFELLSKIRKEGLMSIEGDVEDPHSSPIFSKYPAISHDHHVVEFITDYLRLMVGGNLNAFEIENLMDNEIDTHHHEGEIAPAAIAGLGDGMPAFGIVACVLGVVHTMESVGKPPSELGLMIAHALVGTFIGIFLAYGFVGPLSKILEYKLNDSTKMFQCIKVTLLASLNGYAPQVAVEFGRKVLFSTERPTFIELETFVKQTKSK